jgi:hypothetical protein
MHNFIDEIKYKNNIVILFKTIGHISFIRLKTKDASHRNQGNHCKYFINGWYIYKIMNTYPIIHVATDDCNNHLLIIWCHK